MMCHHEVEVLVIVESAAMQKKSCAASGVLITDNLVFGAMKSWGTILFSCDISALCRSDD